MKKEYTYLERTDIYAIIYRSIKVIVYNLNHSGTSQIILLRE